MWQSKDISLVIITAVAVFILTLFVFQTANMITGLPGANYIFTFGMATLVSLTFLLFEGRRWRFFMHNVLVSILTLPTSLAGQPYDITPRLIVILAGIPADIILNTLYKYFKNNNKLVWWSILSGTGFFLLLPFFQILIFPLYLPSQFIATFASIVIIMLPWIIGGGIAGGYLGFKIFERVNKL